jgi:molecular chaperone GrpE
MVKKAKKDDLKETSDFQEKPVTGEKAEEMDSMTVKYMEKEKEAAENYDKYVRAVAELENVKKRAAREKIEAIKYGNEKLLKDILPMVDSLDCALKQSDASDDFEAFRKGLKLTQDQLLSCLVKHGVERVDCVDKTFDPNVHEALFQIDSDVHSDNQIVDELEKGYLLNGRLLRPARVSVCKKAKPDECEES